MIPGSPLLAAWHTDGTLRVYELAGNVFVPLGVAGGLTHDTGQSPPLPLLSWDRDVINTLRRVSTQGQIGGYDIMGNLVASNSPGTIGVNTRFAASRNEDFFAQWQNGIIAVRRLNHDTMNYGSPSQPQLSGTFSGKTAFAFSPSGRIAATIYNNVGSQYSLAVFEASPAQPTWPWTFLAPTTRLVTSGTGPDIIQVTNDDSNILVGLSGDTFVRVYQADATPLPNINLTKGLRAISVAPYGRNIAISTLDGGAYETNIYRKVGNFYQQIQTIAGLGSMLTFSADGSLLIDAARRLMYRWNPSTKQFDEVPGALANVTIGAVVQAVSDHVAAASTTAHWYAAGVQEIAAQAVSTDAIRFTLLTSAAPAFDPAQATKDAAVGGGEVTDGQWPLNGYLLENFDAAPTGVNMATWVFDNLSHLAMFSGITFVSILIYEDDGADGIPLLRIDFPQEVTIPIDNKVEFILTDGLVTFTP